MRSLGLALAAVVLFSGFASGQESYTVNATAGQVTDPTAIVDISNEQVCRGLSLALTCTQAQACTAKGAPGGASCTAAQARGAGVRIYPQTLAGREEFVTFALVAPQFIEKRVNVPVWNQLRACLKWQTDNTTARNASCAAAGLPNGCTLYPSTCS